MPHAVMLCRLCGNISTRDHKFEVRGRHHGVIWLADATAGLELVTFQKRRWLGDIRKIKITATKLRLFNFHRKCCKVPGKLGVKTRA